MAEKDAAIAQLAAHDWPGNVAELSNALKQAVITAEGPSVRASDLPALPQPMTSRSASMSGMAPR